MLEKNNKDMIIIPGNHKISPFVVSPTNNNTSNNQASDSLAWMPVRVLDYRNVLFFYNFTLGYNGKVLPINLVMLSRSKCTFYYDLFPILLSISLPLKTRNESSIQILALSAKSSL